MAMTLNGIAQGYIADRVTRLFEAEGLTEILVDAGELRAAGGMPGGGDWPVELPGGRRTGLRDRALATSAPLGTAFDAEGRVGHILDPRSGRPAPASGPSVTVAAPTAALADALSTALCLLGDREGEVALGAFRGCRRIAT
jgi:thiamine biosynthesis lipoprotein